MANGKNNEVENNSAISDATSKNSSRFNFWLTLSALVIVALIIFGGTKFFGGSSPAAKATAQKAVDFINTNLLVSGTPPFQLGEVVEESGVYKISLKLGEETATAFLSKDGKLFFPDAFILEPRATSTPTTLGDTTQNTRPFMSCETMPKSDRANLEVFVVSQCPYGTQLQRVLSEAIQNLPEIANYITVRYIGEITDNQIVSMHGPEEAQENLRQICFRAEQKNLYWSYVNCYLNNGDSASCLKNIPVDEIKLDECMKDPNRGLSYAKIDFERQNSYQVEASPTLILNGVEISEGDFGGRTPEAIKTIICCGFNNQPEFCSQTLSTTQGAVGFSNSN